MNNNKKNIEEYSITGFSEIISSPIFLAVLVLSFILGISSVFGFFQNPQKLRTIINMISERVFISEVRSNIQFPQVADNSKGNDSLPTLHQLKTVYKKDGYVTASSLQGDRYSIFSKAFNLDISESVDNGKSIISFDYDVTSKNFWADLNAEIGFDGDQNIYSNYIESNLRRISGVQAPFSHASISAYYDLKENLARYSLVSGMSTI